MGWTDEQQKVIDLRDRNILVSAAAGSGKTAVLVERIITRVTDKEHPVDIDELLVVTFTNAAAAEMRERIGKAINKALEKDPQNENLLKQVALVHNAKITTIDSFCNYIVKNHFGEIGLDPNFRIADQGEITLLKQDTVEEIFQEAFVQKEENFIRFVDAYAGGRSAKNVKEMVLALVNKSESASWPMEWLDSLTKIYRASREELEESPLFAMVTENFRSRIAAEKDKIPALVDFAKSHVGLEALADTFTADGQMYDTLLACHTYGALSAAYGQMKYVSAARIPNKDEILDAKNYLTDARKAAKANVDNYGKKYFTLQLDEIAQQNARLLPYVEELVHLAKEVLLRLEEKKKKKHMVDFCDMEHYALRILREEQGDHAPKKTAVAFRQHFAEIMIDEYQDSNQVQEDILTAISRMEDGEYNMFMVGDVKQSIYRFRQAKPELFMEKYERYAADDTDASGNPTKEQKIELRANFRSRPGVLAMANDICYKLMSADIGGVPYTEEVALHAASTKYDATVPGMESEVLMFDTTDPAIAELGEEESGKRLLEARMVASKILELKEKLQITEEEKIKLPDGSTESRFVLRPMRFGDVVILLRSNKGWGDVFADTLNACGVPAHVESTTGYFSASEVVTILDFLRILDNPYQDIPMAAVLKSQLVGLDDEELAEIALREEKTFSRKAMKAMEEAEEGPLQQFYLLFTELRARCDLPIHELIEEILKRTGYDKYVAALPAGERRLANLAMLQEKAVAFEETSYKGLFHFVRYIEQLRRYEVDYGEAETAGDNSDTVRIMTIHKSKGLEFPVVFVSGMSKGFNETDTKGDLVLHSDFGIGIYEQQTKPRVRKNSLIRNLIEEKCKEDMYGEEFRMLYVAFTRASEKMILTGTVKGEEEYDDCEGNALPHQPISYESRCKAKLYTNWLLPALASYRQEEKYPIQFYRVEDLVAMEASAKAEAAIGYAELCGKIDGVTAQETEAINKAFGYQYPHVSSHGMKVKYAVSDLKHLAMDAFLQKEAEETQARLTDFKHDMAEQSGTTAESREQQEAVPETEELRMTDSSVYVPRFAQNLADAGEQTAGSGKGKYGILAEAKDAGANPGALRGTATHRIMECIDFAALLDIDCHNAEAVQNFRKEQVACMLQKGLLTEEENRLVKREWIDHFLMSDTATRMAAAASRGELYKEQPFVMRYTDEKYKDILIQGIIDVFWKEGDKVVVLDYKTDAVDSKEKLVGLYKEQLELYGYALCKAYQLDSEDQSKRETLIYSFQLQEVISL